MKKIVKQLRKCQKIISKKMNSEEVRVIFIGSFHTENHDKCGVTVHHNHTDNDDLLFLLAMTMAYEAEKRGSLENARVIFEEVMSNEGRSEPRVLN